MDIDKCEGRIKNISDDTEIKLLNKCLSKLEEEIPLCDVPFNKDELEKMRSRSMMSIKPVVVFDDIPEVNDIITRALDKAQVVFFYTAGKKEVHAWPVARNSDIVTCAGKIHTDLARGFIRADVVSFNDIMTCHSMNDAKAKGLAKVVDKDYIIADSDVIEIRYNV
jgi:ribosome-binding ATPase YchF (GTP1/OBG family)